MGTVPAECPRRWPSSFRNLTAVIGLISFENTFPFGARNWFVVEMVY